MEKLVEELRRIIPFKDTTAIGDIVLIVSKNPQMLVYAMVTDITADKSRKDEWWHVGLTVLAVPPQEMTWTLRTPQMTGMEIFTMGGEQRFIKSVDFDFRKQNSAAVSEIQGDTKNKEKGFLKRVK